MSRELPSCEDAKVTVVLMWLFLMTSETEAKDHTTIHRRQGHTTIPLFSGVVITSVPFHLLGMGIMNAFFQPGFCHSNRYLLSCTSAFP